VVTKKNTILYTDHKPLIGLFNNKEPNNSRQTRWVVTLSMLKVIVKYEPGKKNVVADALSNLNSKEIESKINANKEIIICTINNPYLNTNKIYENNLNKILKIILIKN